MFIFQPYLVDKSVNDFKIENQKHTHNMLNDYWDK